MEDNKYVHETIVIRTEVSELLEDLTQEQKGNLLDCVMEFARTGEVIKSKDKESNLVFKTMISSLKYYCDKYADKKAQNQHTGKLGGIISAMQKGILPKGDNLQFLKDNGYYTQTFFREKRIPEEVIKLLIEG